MTREELKDILTNHARWIAAAGGARANLSGANLSRADLREADLREANLIGANLRGANLSRANLREANLRNADLREADLREASLIGANLIGANLREADLRGANLDYSALPLWCGSFDVKVDKRIASQIAYHFCRLDCDDPEFIVARNAIKDLANQFRRVKEGELEVIKTEDGDE